MKKSKLSNCNKCGNKTLTKRNFGSGLVSYCHFDKGFFNKEGEFIKEGDSYFDKRYKHDYWSWCIIISLISTLIISILINLLFGVIFGAIVLFCSIFMFFRLDKNNFFIG